MPFIQPEPCRCGDVVTKRISIPRDDFATIDTVCAKCGRVRYQKYLDDVVRMADRAAKTARDEIWQWALSETRP